MSDSATSRTFRFDDFLLDGPARILLRIRANGQEGQVQIGSRAFQILLLLVERQGAVVSRQEIMDAAWPNLAVEDNNLSVQLSNLRRALDVERDGASCIQTVPGRGYRFLPSVTVSARRPPETPQYDGEAARTAPIGAANPASGHDTEADAAEMPVGPSPPIHVTPGSPEPDGVFATPLRRSPSRQRQTVVFGLFGAVLVASLAWVGARSPWVDRPPGTPLPHSSPRTVDASRTLDAPGTALPTEEPRIRRRLSVAILPFSQLSGTDDGTAAAFVETLTAELAQHTGMVVIGSAATRWYQERPADLRRIGDDLKVRYAVEGDIRKEDDRHYVIQAHLVSTETGEYLWAERFIIAPDERNETVVSVARGAAFMVASRAADDESQRVTRERAENLNVEDVLLLAESVYNMPGNPRKYERLTALYERALELDPASLRGMTGLAEALLNSTSRWTEDPMADAKLRRAAVLIDQAETLRPNDRMVMLARLQLLGKRDACSELFPVARRVKEWHPSLSSPDFFQGWCQLRAGDPTAAIESFEASIRVHPRNPEVDSRHAMIGFALLSLGRYEESATAQRRALAANPTASARRRAATYAGIAAALALSGDMTAARQSAAEAARLWPTLTVRGFFPFGPPTSAAAATYERLWNGLRMAGLRDRADEDFDPHLPADDTLRTEYEAPTPVGTPGVPTIRTPELVDLLRRRPALVLDTDRDGASIPGAIGLEGAGVGGTLSDQYQDRLLQVVRTLRETGHPAPIVTVGWNAERFQGRNLALRLAGQGYGEVYWYRGGREAWMAAGLEVAPVSPQEW